MTRSVGQDVARGDATPRLAAAGIVRVFPGGAGVHGMDLQVAAGEIHALVGLNGAGKTTLLRLLLGMLRPDAGSVRIDGVDLGHLAAARWSRVGHLVGQPFAYPELRTRANLALAARLRGVPPGDVARIVASGLADMALDEYSEVRARVLSEGNRLRLGLASALQHEPDLVVLDEPTSALDPAGVILLREALLRRAAAGAGVLVSSHHLDEVARVADRITVLNRGRVIGALDPHGLDIERAFFARVYDDDEERGGR